jgi:hypothetical protein
MVTLAIRERWRLELDELSALGLRATADGDELLGVSDSSFVVGVGSLEPEHEARTTPDLGAQVAEWTERPEEGSQWEGVAADGAGRVFVLQEHAGRKRAPSHVFVFAPALDELGQTIVLDVADGDSEWRQHWTRDKNARGESLVLLEDGHLLVFKQKDPVRLIEFGPAGEVAGGFGADRLLDPADSFALHQDATQIHYEPLASWGLDAEAARILESVNDAATHEGELYVLSRSSHVVARLENDAGGVAVRAAAGIPAEIEHPEGLVVLEGRVPLVADDRPPKDAASPNVFALSEFPD